jgi:hypothetical protein
MIEKAMGSQSTAKPIKLKGPGSKPSSSFGRPKKASTTLEKELLLFCPDPKGSSAAGAHRSWHLQPI